MPFRLRRMMVAAMDAAGVDGNFRTASLLVLRVLREHKESLAAALEAHILDPIVSAKLCSEKESVSAVHAVGRVIAKLTGRDFGDTQLSVEKQLDRLVREATSVENLCRCYIGWCPFW